MSYHNFFTTLAPSPSHIPKTPDTYTWKMSILDTYGAAVAAFCGALGTSGWCVLRRFRELRALRERRRDVFEERAWEWLDEETDAPYCSVEDMMRKAVDYDSPRIRERLSHHMAASIASTIQEILRSDHAPHHVIGHLEEVLSRLSRLQHMLKASRETLLLPHLTPNELKQFEAWQSLQVTNGWKAFFAIVFKYHYGQIHALVASVLYGVVTPLLSEHDSALMRGVLSQETVGVLLPLLLKCSALQILSTALQYFSSTFVTRLSARTSRKIRKKCVNNISRSDLAFLHSLQNYHVVDSLERDQEELKRAVSGLQHISQFAAHFAALFSIKRSVTPTIGLVCFSSAVLYRLLVYLLRRLELYILVSYEEEDIGKQGMSMGYKSLWDLFGCVNTFVTYRFYGQETRLAEQCLQVDEKAHDMVAHNTSLLSTLLKSDGSVELVLRRCCRVLGCLLGGGGEVVDIFSNFEEVVQTGVNALSMVQSMRSLWLPSLRVHLLLNLPRTIDRGDDAGLRSLDGPHDLCFSNLTFCYGSGETVLRNVSFRIPAGANVGIVGPSGCGKSTLLSLLSRLYDPTEGSVQLAGRNLREYNVGWLRREVISGTGHFMRVFADSIYDNVRVSRPDATPQEVMAAMHKASASEFAQDKGLHSRTEWGPPELSAGQEVRLFLARALLAQPSILVLDEVTAHLDALTEDAIRQQIANLAEEGTTVINVSHRLSFLKDCSAIIVFDESGRVAAAGTHQQLLASCAWYASACEKQAPLQ